MQQSASYVLPSTQSRYKPKTYIDKRGYKRFTNSDILVHRYVAQKKLGRWLRRGEVIHHIDGNKLNNAPSNLEVYSSWDEHTAVHQRNKILYRSWHKPAN